MLRAPLLFLPALVGAALASGCCCWGTGPHPWLSQPGCCDTCQGPTLETPPPPPAGVHPPPAAVPPVPPPLNGTGTALVPQPTVPPLTAPPTMRLVPQAQPDPYRP
jgi:hypothetical protein